MGERKAQQIAKDFRRKAGRKFGIRRMILFGSHATGKMGEGSDIDLIVVADGFGSRASFMSKLYREWHIVQKKGFAVDFLPYTPKEFERLRKQVSIVSMALKEGVEIE